MKLKAYQDRESGRWKWGTRGKPIYESKLDAERAGINELTEGLRRVRDRLNNELLNYGK